MQTLQVFQRQQNALKFSRNINIIFIVIVLSFILITLILNAVFLEPLYLMGVVIIDSLQNAIKSSFFQVLMNIISFICNTPFVGIVFALELVIVRHKFKAIIHLSFFLLGFYFIAVFKQAYQQSRPIWTLNSIENYQWFCPTDFGNPSGHSYVPFPMFQPLIAKYIGFQNLKVAWIFLIFFGIVVPFSRMYLGVHSINQVFFGLSFGIAWTVFYRYGLRELFYKIYSRIYKLKKISILLTIIFLHVLITIIPIIIFKLRQSTPMAQNDIENLNRLCDSNLTSRQIQTSMFLICILQSAVFGIVYGLFNLPLSNDQIQYFTGNWNYRSYLTAFLHCVIMLVIAGIFPAFALFILPLFLKEPYSRFIILNIGLTIGGMLFICLVPIICDRFRWIQYNIRIAQTSSTPENIHQKNANYEDLSIDLKV